VSARYESILDEIAGVSLWVDFMTDRGTMVNYTVVLLLATAAGAETIRVYDAAHGYNEMHRYTQSEGKQTGTVFHSGSLGEGMRAAIEETERGYLKMIEGWRK
jgi:hypothetical protein